MRYLFLAIAYFCILFIGCNSSKESTENKSVEALSPTNTQNNEAVIFALRVEQADGYAAGQPSSLAVILTSKGVYHINQEYPTAVAISPPAAITFKKNNLLKPDAVRFDEKLAKFELAFSAGKSGTYPLEIKASFAMCTTESCIPFDKTLAVTLSVK